MITSKYILKCIEEPERNTKANRKYDDFEDSIKKILSHSLQFPLAQPQLTELKRQLVQTQIQKSQYLTLWQTILKKQLGTFVRQTKSILNVYQYPSKEKNQKKDQETLKKIQKLFSSAIVKLEFCVEEISKVLLEVYQKRQWCKCERKICPVRFDSALFKKKLKYEFLNAEQTKWATLHLQKARLLQVDLQKLPESKYNLFGIDDDMKCDILSIQNCGKKQSKKNQESERVIKSLMNMKILQKGRQSCNVSFSWLQKMKTKVQQNS